MYPWRIKLISLLSLLIVIDQVRDERICGSVDARNSPSTLEALRNCTTIVGYLQIVLMDNSTPEDFAEHSYPELVEVTNFVLLYRVRGLISLSGMFPNLQVIRGQKLLANYALVIYDMPDMEEIGLHSLSFIQHGSVRLEYNPNLCYVHTVNWRNITGSSSSFFMNNKHISECSENCRHCHHNHCWNKNMCQIFATRKQNCHEQCLGDCFGPGPHQCKLCKGFKSLNTCVAKCPEDRLYLHDSLRCILPKRCPDLWRGGVIHANSCLPDCPAGYTKGDNGKCEKCSGRCPKICDGATIATIADAEHLKGCTVIDGSLQIKLSETSDISEDLKNNLDELEEIKGILKIHRSFPLKSLYFMPNLKIIHGDTDLESNKYSLLVFENQNLQSLFNISELRIKNGTVLFNNNPYLCLSEIEKFLHYSNLVQLSIKDIVPYWNGYKASCDSIKIEIFSRDVHTNNVTLCWQHYFNTSSNGYIIYHIKAPEQNMKIYYGMDTCLENAWNGTQVKQISNRSFVCYILSDLEPFTQYAYYVKSYDLDSPNITSIQEVQSDLKYFKTLTDQPSVVQRIRTISKNSSSLTISWQPPATPNGILSHYKIYVFHHPDENDFLDQRNYCMVPMEPKETVLEHDEIEQEKCICPDERPLISIDVSNPFCTESVDSPYSCTQYEYEYSPHRSRTRRALTPQVRVKEFLDVVVDGYYEVTTKNFSAQYTQYTINNLRHYGLYTLQLAACNVNERYYEICSPIEHFTDRVGKNASADNIVDFGFEMNGRDVVLKWSEPEKPNGVIVTYFLEYGKYEADTTSYMVKCITRLQHAMANFTHTLQLPQGMYKARVKAQSLAGEGVYTKNVEFNVTRISVNGTEPGFIVLYCIPGVCAFLALIYCIRKNKCGVLNTFRHEDRFTIGRSSGLRSAERNFSTWQDTNFGFSSNEDAQRHIAFDELTEQLFDDTSPNLSLIKRDFSVRYTPYPTELTHRENIGDNQFLTRATIESHINEN